MRFRTIVQRAVISAGVAGFGFGFDLVDDHWDPVVIRPMFVVGILVMILSAMVAASVVLWSAISTRLRAFEDVFAEGYQVGHGRGYWEARREAGCQDDRPKVVALRR